MAKMSVIVARAGFEELAKTHVHKSTFLSVAVDEEAALANGIARIQEELDAGYAVYTDNTDAYEILDFSGEKPEVVGWEVQAYLTNLNGMGYYQEDDYSVI